MHPTPRFHSLVVLLTVLLLTLPTAAAAGAPVRAAELRAAVTGAPAALPGRGDQRLHLRPEGRRARRVCFGADLGLTKRLQTPAGEVFTQFDIGEQHGCGVRPNGTLLCWGGNFHIESWASAAGFAQVAAGSRSRPARSTPAGSSTAGASATAARSPATGSPR